MQREVREGLAGDLLGVVQCLLFRDPQGGLGDGHGEVVDLDAVELVDADLDERFLAAELDVALAVEQVGYRLVLQFAQAQERFGEEVAGPARGIEEPQRGELVLERLETVRAGAFAQALVVLYGLELGLEAVEEERVDEPVDVLHGGVVHAALAPLVVAQGLLHQGAEDDGADVLPVEPVPRVDHRVADLVEQTAVDVVEPGELVLEVLVALVLRGVEHLEQVDDCAAQMAGVVALHVVAERVHRE